MKSAILNIDKPAGLTSHDVVNRVRRIAGTRRVGHGGTLDPLATGVLIVAVERATRLLEYITGQPKTYEATVRLGTATTTYDAEGEIVAERPVNLSEAAVREALPQFEGDIQQLPPMYSAVKQGGKALYKLARQGIEVAREYRPVTIYELTLLNWQPPDLELRVRCSAGTYIRSLAHDLGQALGCGGFLAALRRTAIGDFRVEQAVPLDELTTEDWQHFAQPADQAVAHLPRLDLPDAAAQHLLHGRRIQRTAEQPQQPVVRAYDPAGNFIGILTAVNDSWKPHKIWAQ